MDSSLTLYLTKLAPVFLYPVGSVLLISLFGLIIGYYRTRSPLPIFALAAAWLWITSMPVFADFAVATLEKQYPARPIEATPKADVAIVLGGAVSQPAPPRVTVDLNKSADRVLQAFKLYKAGRVDRILVTGGNVPWRPEIEPEANLIRSLLIDWGIPSTSIEIAGQSRNTFENALEIKTLWEKKPFDSALLITSASHMPRAMGVFKKAGLPVTASTTDIEALKDVPNTMLQWLPSASALEMTTVAAKEWFGYWAYRLRGYL